MNPKRTTSLGVLFCDLRELDARSHSDAMACLLLAGNGLHWFAIIVWLGELRELLH